MNIPIIPPRLSSLQSALYIPFHLILGTPNIEDIILIL